MSGEVLVKVTLEGPDPVGGVWVTFLPVRQLDPYGVQRAAGEVFALFLGNLAREEAALEERLKPIREAQWAEAERRFDEMHRERVERIQAELRGDAV